MRNWHSLDIDHPGLSLARESAPWQSSSWHGCLAQEGKKADAANASRSFLAGWEREDRNYPLSLQVRKELQAL